ncbi:glycoside hydrolase family 16 protein [Kitasatospora sp. NBC_01266]|uniref:glycoside hydrolase family 16 protein n=1 Tax=Kitasatospora sp. NBC_01266 TaxID=2903572 RepID=UPI002E35630F|nr:hypothetical protein [Kitasatospora sp. NBC_01266]
MLPLTSHPARTSTSAGALALLVALAAGPAYAGTRATPQVFQDRLTPTSALPDSPVTAQLTVRSSSCFTVKTLGVGVRDAKDNNLDFPGSLSNTQICPSGLTLTTGARSFPAGTYRIFGFYQDQAGTWRNLPEQTLTVSTPTPVVTRDKLTPTTATADTPVTGQLTVHSNVCFTAKAVGIGVRNEAGDNLDFPGGLGSTQICPSGLTLTTGARSFPAGTYRIFGFYQDQAGTWRNLPEQTLVVSGTAPVITSPIPGASLIWSDEFNAPLSPAKWNKVNSSAYRFGNHNPDDDKLDRIDPNGVKVANGVATLTAKPSGFSLPGSGRKAWDTGLITTENTAENFKVKTGDYAETRVRLPKDLGAWPALWTWRNGGNEIDSFEYHPDNPNLLELTNHVKPAQKYWNNKDAVQPGQWVTIGTHYGADSVGWYVNGVDVFEDHKGVGANWTAYLILNLSICSGSFHPGPVGTAPISFDSDYVRVFR